VAATDRVVRALIEKDVGQPVLAFARFGIAGANSATGAVEAVSLFSVGGLIRRRGQASWPTPAYLAVCESIVNVFSARFDRGTRLIGPVMVWRRDLVDAVTVDGQLRVRVRPAPNRPVVELEAVEPGPESARVIRYLCEGPEGAGERQGH
jgi:hypothetical protein